MRADQSEAFGAQIARRRKAKGWTQETLAAKSGVGESTLRRIESGAGNPPSQSTCEKLEKALGPDFADKGQDTAKAAPTSEGSDAFTRNANIAFDAQVWTHIDKVRADYGLSVRQQFEFAPLAISILAEMSLAWRQQLLDQVEAKLEEAVAFGEQHPHLSFMPDLEHGEVSEALAAEGASISARDIFGEKVANLAYAVGFNHVTKSPFLAFLKSVAKDLGSGSGIAVSSDYSFGTPLYTIRGDLIRELVGLPKDASKITDDHRRAMFALQRFYVRFRDIPAGLLGGGKTEERVNWLKGRVPEADWQEQNKPIDLSSLGDLNFDDWDISSTIDQMRIDNERIERDENGYGGAK